MENSWKLFVILGVSYIIADQKRTTAWPFVFYWNCFFFGVKGGVPLFVDNGISIMTCSGVK